MTFETFTLSNGIRLIHCATNTKVAHCGVILNTGSRDEKAPEWGIAHFIEHAMFKGTHKRKPYHILCRMEDVGGELNAYTSKEETCIYTSFLSKDYRRAMELMCDVIFNSVFPEKELEKEKEVILDEMNSYKDSPSELIFDDFEALIFEKSSIGRSVLGTPERLKSFNRNKVINFIKSNYHTDQMVISSVGNIAFGKLVKMATEYFEPVPENRRKHNRTKPDLYTAKSLTLEKNTHQAHCILGNEAYNLSDCKRLPLALLANILGGPGMNSRLNLSLREKHGLAYNVEANYTPYTDTGAFHVYFGTDKGYLEKCLKIIEKEMDLLCKKQLGIAQLHKAINQMTGQIAIASENNENQMLNIGKSYLLYNKVDSLEEIFKKITAITAKQLLEVANEILNKNNLSSLLYQ